MSRTASPRSPLFRLIESYVLDALGALPAEAEASTANLVRQLFRTRRPWRAVVEEQLGFTAALRAQLAALWAENRATAAAQGATLTERDFATMVVDENFADAIEMLATEITGPDD